MWSTFRNDDDHRTGNRKVKEYVKKFQEQNGSYLCRELKGVETGKVLRSCPDCIRDAVALTEEYLAAQKQN